MENIKTFEYNIDRYNYYNDGNNYYDLSLDYIINEDNNVFNYSNNIKFADNELKNLLIAKFGSNNTITREQLVNKIGFYRTDIISKLKFVDITRTFPTNIKIYGLSTPSTTKTSDSYVNFYCDETTNYIKLYMWYKYWGYYNGSGGYGYVAIWNDFPHWINYNGVTTDMYYNFFNTSIDDSTSKQYINKYVYFRNIDGYQPQNFKVGSVRALVNEDDL